MKRLRHYFAIAMLLALASAVSAQDFPVTFEHKFGTTMLEEKPKKFVSLSFMNHDNFLALGVTPDAIRYWYGEHEHGVWPWAADKLGDKKPIVLKGELNIEQLAALKPDVIEAFWSGITKEQYELLSKIAPVIPPLKGYGDYSMPWDVMALTTGKITGKNALAKKLVSQIKGRVTKARVDHPKWQGATAAVAYYASGSVGAYTSEDIRPKFLSTLGFSNPEKIESGNHPNAFATPISAEDLSPLESDVLIWFGDKSSLRSIRKLALRKTLKAHREGRELHADQMLSSAFSHASLLSLPYVIDTIVPLLEAAIDGDPKTPVPSSVSVGLAP